MKFKAKILIALIIFIVVVVVGIIIFTLSNKHITPQGLLVGEIGNINEWEFVLNKVDFEQSSDNKQINVTAYINVKYQGNDEIIEYTPNYSLFCLEYKYPYENTNGWENGEKFIFTQENKEHDIKAIFNVEKADIYDKKAVLKLVLGAGVKYIIEKPFIS